MKLNTTYALPVVLAACFLFSTGCGKAGADSPATPAPVAAPSAQKANTGEVVMDPAAPELKQMIIETVRDVPVAVDEVTATARIQANPHSVGHAVVPVPGRIVRVMTKLSNPPTGQARSKPRWTKVLLQVEAMTLGRRVDWGWRDWCALTSPTSGPCRRAESTGTGPPHGRVRRQVMAIWR